MKQLHVRTQEDELGIQLVKSLNEKVIKNAIAQAVVSNCLLEDQLRVIPATLADITWLRLPNMRLRSDSWNQQILRLLFRMVWHGDNSLLS